MDVEGEPATANMNLEAVDFFIRQLLVVDLELRKEVVTGFLLVCKVGRDAVHRVVLGKVEAVRSRLVDRIQQLHLARIRLDALQDVVQFGGILYSRRFIHRRLEKVVQHAWLTTILHRHHAHQGLDVPAQVLAIDYIFSS